MKPRRPTPARLSLPGNDSGTGGAYHSSAADRRAVNIHLTDAGSAMWLDVNQCGQRVRERAMQGMSDTEREQLTRMLEQVRDNLSLSDT